MSDERREGVSIGAMVVRDAPAVRRVVGSAELHSFRQPGGGGFERSGEKRRGAERSGAHRCRECKREVVCTQKDFFLRH